MVLLLHPVKRSIAFSYSLSEKDTRIVASEWISNNIPKGSKIVIESGVPIPNNKYDISHISSISLKLPEEYRREGFKYLIANSWIYLRYYSKTLNKYEQIMKERYDVIWKEFHIIKEIRGNDKFPISWHNPTVKIIKVD